MGWVMLAGRSALFKGDLGRPKASQIRADGPNRAHAATGNAGHLDAGERLTENHVSNLLMLGDGKIRRNAVSVVGIVTRYLL